jgi:DNA-binding phage protein
MKDNFDLKKFLKENKSIEKSNPYLKEEMSDSEKEKVDREVDAVRDDLDQISKLAKDAGEDAEDIKSALREKVREMVIAELEDTPLEEAKEEEVEDEEVEVETEEEVEVEDGEEEEIDVTDEETTTEEGEFDAPEMEGDEGEVLSHLMKALGIAKSMDNEKLIQQLGNTVTFLTRQYISGE